MGRDEQPPPPAQYLDVILESHSLISSLTLLSLDSIRVVSTNSIALPQATALSYPGREGPEVRASAGRRHIAGLNNAVNSRRIASPGLRRPGSAPVRGALARARVAGAASTPGDGVAGVGRCLARDASPQAPGVGVSVSTTTGARCLRGHRRGRRRGHGGGGVRRRRRGRPRGGYGIRRRGCVGAGQERHGGGDLRLGRGGLHVGQARQPPPPLWASGWPSRRYTKRGRRAVLAASAVAVQATAAAVTT